MVFAWHRGAAISVAAFEAAAHALAARLPQKPYAVNLCEDRYAFILAFAACLLARQTTLLPPSRAPEAVNDSCAGRVADRLTDEEVLAPLGAQGRGGPIVVEAGHGAGLVFTSGRTGRPLGHAKTWGSRVAGARALGARLGAAGSVIGPIPPQHMFGP